MKSTVLPPFDAARERGDRRTARARSADHRTHRVRDRGGRHALHPEGLVSLCRVPVSEHQRELLVVVVVGNP